MPDLKKVIKGLEICVDVDDGETCPKHCPYYQEVCHGYGQLMRDALALLKGLEETMIELIEQAKAEDYWAKKCRECELTEAEKIHECQLCRQR